MSNYKETSISGSKYQRAKAIIIQNRLDGEKKITFIEELVKIFDNETVKIDVGSVSEKFDETNITEQFNLINPVDGSVISTMTYQDAYVVLFSLYNHIAMKRDGV